MPRFITPFTPMYRCSKYTPETAISATSGTSGAACGLEGALDKVFHHHQIGYDPVLGRASQNRVGIGAPKLPHRIPLIVHYPILLTMAPDPRSLALRLRTRFQRLKSHVRASISLVPAIPLLFLSHARISKWGLAKRLVS